MGFTTVAQTLNSSYLDDLSGDEMTPAEATTVSWSWRGVEYELDTRAEHLPAPEADEQSVTLGMMLASSRRVGGRQHTARPISGDSNPSAAEASAAAIRAWAINNGILVPSRGRVPQSVRDAYAYRG